MLSALLSALAAVYTEWVMKRTSDSLYWQNMQLYSFGVAFNALGLTIADARSGAPRRGCPSRALRLPAPPGALSAAYGVMGSSHTLTYSIVPYTIGCTAPASGGRRACCVALARCVAALATGNARRLCGRLLADRAGARLQLGDGAGGGQPGVQRAARFVGHEVCRLHHEGARPARPAASAAPRHALAVVLRPVRVRASILLRAVSAPKGCAAQAWSKCAASPVELVGAMRAVTHRQAARVRFVRTAPLARVPSGRPLFEDTYWWWDSPESPQCAPLCLCHPGRPQVYATSSAMLVTMAISVAFFGLEPSLQLLLGILTAAVSLVLYYVPPATLTAKPEPRADKPGSSDDLQRLPR